MKRILMVILIFGIICTMGCENSANKDSSDSSKTEEIMMNQKIVFFRHYSSYSDFINESGFYVDVKGNKVEYDITETYHELSEQAIKRKQEFNYISVIYKIILELAESSQNEGENYLSPEEVSKCYKLLVEMGDDYKINEKNFVMDEASTRWYGVIDDGENEPKIILLSGEGVSEISNSHKNAKKILDILTNQRQKS